MWLDRLVEHGIKLLYRYTLFEPWKSKTGARKLSTDCTESAAGLQGLKSLVDHFCDSLGRRLANPKQGNCYKTRSLSSAHYGRLDFLLLIYQSNIYFTFHRCQEYFSICRPISVCPTARQKRCIYLASSHNHKVHGTYIDNCNWTDTPTEKKRGKPLHKTHNPPGGAAKLHY
jgi:hypothetical protein